MGPYQFAVALNAVSCIHHGSREIARTQAVRLNDGSIVYVGPKVGKYCIHGTEVQLSESLVSGSIPKFPVGRQLLVKQEGDDTHWLEIEDTWPWGWWGSIDRCDGDLPLRKAVCNYPNFDQMIEVWCGTGNQPTIEQLNKTHGMMLEPGDIQLLEVCPRDSENKGWMPIGSPHEPTA